MTNQISKNNGNYLFYILTGIISDIGILYLPSAVMIHANQDGWISVIIASIYPLSIVLCSIYLKHKHSNENILMLSHRYLGRLLGGFCNLIFMLKFILFLSSSASGNFTYIKTYTALSINNYTFVFIFLIIGAFGATLGLNTLIKMSMFIFYFTIPIFITGLNVLKYGNFLNLMPVMDSSITQVLKGSLHALYPYSGMEVLLVIYNDFEDKKNLTKYSLLSLLHITALYTGLTILLTVYWESSLVIKTLWPVVYTFESIRNPIINNLRFILLYFGTMATLKSSSLYYYFTNKILTQTFNKLKIKDYYLVIYIFTAMLALTFKNEIMRRELSNKIMTFLFLFDLLFIFVIIIFTIIKKDEVYEK